MQPDKRNRAALVFCCLLVFLCTACDSANKTIILPAITKAPASKQIFVKPILGSPGYVTLDPALVTDLPSASIVNMLYEGLVEISDNGGIQKTLAQNYSEGPDGLTWTFTLRDHLQFNDGTPLTSADVAYSLDRALQPATRSLAAPYYLRLIKDSDKLASGQIKTLIGDSILTPDAKTVVIVTSRRAAYFLYTLTNQTAYVVEKSFVTKYGTQFTKHLSQGGSSGPWQLAHYIPQKEIDFVPNTHYAGQKTQLRKIVRPFYMSASTAYKDYRVDRLDSTPVPVAQLAQVKQATPGQYHQYPLLAINYLAMNYLVKPFDNIKIRQAFALALNKDLITAKVYTDSAIATNHIIPTDISGSNTNLTGPAGGKGTAGDAATARKLFAAGLREEKLTQQQLPPIVLSVPGSNTADVREQYAVFQQMWQQALGITVTIDYVDYAKLQIEIGAATNNAHGLMFWYASWIADYPDAQDWTSLQFARGSQLNNMNYGQNSATDAVQQQAVQQALAQADASTVPAQRQQQYQRAEQQLVNDVAWLPIAQQVASYVQKPCVQGITDTPYGVTPPDDWGKAFISTATPCANTSNYQ
jgi:oligopeptide transport system substrate-binding protein